MALDRIDWQKDDLKNANGVRKYYLGYDIHILRSNNVGTQDLRNHLWAHMNGVGYYQLMDLINDTANNPRQIPGNDFASVKFIPNLIGADNHHNNNLAQPFQINNVKINTKTGVISADPVGGGVPNYMKDFNFVVTVTMVTNSVPAKTRTTSFRVHIHDQISNAWMTPATMDAVAQEPDHMFAVYAEFSDGTIGDITYHPGITWGSNNGNIAVDSSGTFTPNLASIPIGNLKITATTPPALNNVGNNLVIMSGNVTVRDSWQNPQTPIANRPKVEFLGGPGKTLFNDNRNLLIIGEGFTSGEEGAFRKLAADMRSSMKTMVTKKPWNLIANNVNFWSLFLPSQQAECTVRNEQIPYQKLYYDNPGGGWVETVVNKAVNLDSYITFVNRWLQQGSSDPMLQEIELTNNAQPIGNAARYLTVRASAIPAAGDVLLLSRLINKVGLATPGDDALPIADLRAKWRALYDATITTHDIAAVPGNSHVPEDVWKFWRKTGQRRLINHRNTAFKYEFGGTPRTDRFAEAGRGITTCNQRLTRKNFDHLLKTIRYGSSVADPIVGTVWAKNGASFPKDYDLVLVLVRGPLRGGTRMGNSTNAKRTDGTAVSINPNTLYLGPTPGAGSQLELSPVIIHPGLATGPIATATHELGHAFLLDDEYGNSTEAYGGTDQNNLVKLASVQTNGNFDGNKVKWRWLRYASAGSTTANPTANGANQDLKLKAAHLAGFAINDKVRLRKKAIAAVNTANQTPAAEYSAELTILNINPATNKITVSGLANPGTFPKGSILVKLVSAQITGMGTVSIAGNQVNGGGTTRFLTQVGGPGAIIIVGGNQGIVQSVTNDNIIVLTANFPANPANQPYDIIPNQKYAELLNNSIRLSITKNNKPMTIEPYVVPPGQIGVEQQLPEFAQLTFDGADSIYNHLKAGVFPHQVVGLYSGGDEYATGVYHATGYCAMRSSDAAVPFCPVCRYLIVDQIDPSMHGNIDLDYTANNNPGI